VILVNEAAEHIAAADLSGGGIDPDLGPGASGTADASGDATAADYFPRINGG
jgi:hypothetical protein